MNNSSIAYMERESEIEANDAFLNHFRCASRYARFQVSGRVSSTPGLFRFGQAFCYGRTSAGQLSARIPVEQLFDAASIVNTSDQGIALCFDPAEAVENLRRERYMKSGDSYRLTRRLYYSLRPLLPFEARKLLQRCVSQWRRRSVTFPRWPVDCSVEQIFELLMRFSLRVTAKPEIPFIWFWPDGNHAAGMMTHDVEEAEGAAHCEMLMDLDDSFGIKSAFQLIPEGRYDGFPELVAQIRARDFETNIHDLDHDGRLYDDVRQFRRRAEKINKHAHTHGMKGFRAGAMHRNQEWFSLLEFQYEMSVPNVSHLEPQRGGCCTVMPYFVGGLLELPLTTVQDHGLFYILRQQNIDLWKHQIELIYEHHGLITFIVHPDYIVSPRERRLYCDLLKYIEGLRSDRALWWALPGEINLWWRQRSQMSLVPKGNTWQIQGPGSERARIAYATLVDGELTYRIGDDVVVSSSEVAPSRQADSSLATDVG